MTKPCGSGVRRSFEVIEDGKAIKFSPCGVVSWNPNDVKQRWCARCEHWVLPPRPDTVKIWIDDVREPPDESWMWMKGSMEVLGLLVLATTRDMPIHEISFDHDLGGTDTAMPVAKAIEQAAYEGSLPRLKWHVHSANPVGRMNLRACLESADRYWDQREQTDEREHPESQDP